MDIPQSRNAKIRGQINPNPPVRLTGIPILEDPHGPNGHIQAAYENLRAHGQSHSMAEMLAYRQAPGAQTDREFMMGHPSLEQQIGDDNDRHYINQVTSNYRAATGHDPNPGHLYVQTLAQYPGDPRAFVADRGEVKRRAEELNVNVSGMVNHKASEPISDPFATASPMTGRNKIAPDLKLMLKESYKKAGKDASDAVLEAKHGNHTKSK